MPNLPQAYKWIEKLDPLPKMVQAGLELFGTKEQPGPGDNPVIKAWAKEVGGTVGQTYSADSIPWCGLFMAVVARRAGKTPVADPLWALNWGKFGEDAGQPALGDVLTFIREGGGHVALYIAESTTTYHVLGGNQADKVCFIEIAKERLRRARRPLYMNKPATVKPYGMSATGLVSRNEA